MILEDILMLQRSQRTAREVLHNFAKYLYNSQLKTIFAPEKKLINGSGKLE